MTPFLIRDYFSLRKKKNGITKFTGFAGSKDILEGQCTRAHVHDNLVHLLLLLLRDINERAQLSSTDYLPSKHPCHVARESHTRPVPHHGRDPLDPVHNTRTPHIVGKRRR